jgi:hypothetical protein
MLTPKYIYIYGLLVFYCCVTSLDICNCCNPPSLAYIHLYSCLTRTLLLLFLLCVCVCVCRLTGLVESVEESEGLRRDGGWEHGVLQERAAGEAPLHDPASCLCTDACRCCTGTYSGARGATSEDTCVSCGAGENIYVDMYIYVYVYMYVFIPASRLLIYVSAVTLLHLHIFIYTPALLVLYYYFS